MQSRQSLISVIRSSGFSNLWINQILVQLSYNALNFSLVIWVYHLTNSNTAVAALLFAIYLPAVIFGLFAGVLIDITDRKKIILSINLLMAIAFFCLIYFKASYPAILVITFFAAYVFLGTSSDCSNADPVYGGCDTTQDYIPSGKQKSATYAFYAAFLGVPYLWGGLAKYNEIKSKRVKSKSS
ncbi:MFS transporter [Candidatus Daviesbacteria bacterium]|nr:MFS transporter [Candidatus Daviesbacteria bacterium]